MDAERRIIVGYDPEHGGPDVMRLGRMLADVLAAERTVVIALPWPSYFGEQHELEARAEREMGDEFERLRSAEGDPGLRVRAIPSGSAAAALELAAEEEGASLIVVGSCRRGPAGRTLLGSVGESLMHGARCAIAVAPVGYGERRVRRRLNRLAVAYDGSEESRSALQAAVALAERMDGHLTVLTVADVPVYGYAAAWTAFTADEIADADRKHRDQLLHEAFAAIPETVGRDGRVLTGDAGTCLASVSGEFDLMLAGSRAHGSVHRTLLGSTTRQLIRSAECPVLVLPRGAGSDVFDADRPHGC